MSDEILKYIKAKHGDDVPALKQLFTACEEHKDVIDRFGRWGFVFAPLFACFVQLA
jgi:uncharacterized protein (DUF924 family)